MKRIEKGVPIPEPRKQILKTYPIADMEVGDSLLVAPEDVQAMRQTVSLARKTGKTFTVRKVENKYRVWRTE